MKYVIGIVVAAAVGVGGYVLFFQQGDCADGGTGPDCAQVAPDTAMETAQEAVKDAGQDAATAVEKAVKDAAESASDMVGTALDDAGKTAGEVGDAAGQAASDMARDAAASATRLLTVEGFDLDGVKDLIDSAPLEAATKSTLKSAVQAAAQSPVLLQPALDQVKAALGL
jgi:vacuolar-type H+-ATPase subunit H